MNRKARRAALRGALSSHAGNETFALVNGDSFTEPSTKQAVSLLGDWPGELPTSSSRPRTRRH